MHKLITFIIRKVLMSYSEDFFCQHKRFPQQALQHFNPFGPKFSKIIAPSRPEFLQSTTCLSSLVELDGIHMQPCSHTLYEKVQKKGARDKVQPSGYSYYICTWTAIS